MKTSELFLKVLTRAVLLALFALNVFLVPAIHGSLPIPAPGMFVFLQEVAGAQEPVAGLDAVVIPILPEFFAMCAVTVLWARLAKGTFFGGGWIAYLLACVAGTASRVLVPLVGGQRWLPYADLWLIPALVLTSFALLAWAVRVERRFVTSRKPTSPAMAGPRAAQR